MYKTCPGTSYRGDVIIYTSKCTPPRYANYALYTPRLALIINGRKLFNYRCRSRGGHFVRIGGARRAARLCNYKSPLRGRKRAYALASTLLRTRSRPRPHPTPFVIIIIRIISTTVLRARARVYAVYIKLKKPINAVKFFHDDNGDGDGPGGRARGVELWARRGTVT